MPQSIDNFLCTDLVTIEADASLAALEARLDRPIDYGVPVVTAGGRLRGVINPTDILRASMQLGTRARHIPASEFCHRVRACLSSNSSLRRAQRLILTRDLDSLLVLDTARRVVGIIFRSDLERHGLVPNRNSRWRRPMRHPDTAHHDSDRELFIEDQRD